MLTMFMKFDGSGVMGKNATATHDGYWIIDRPCLVTFPPVMGQNQLTRENNMTRLTMVTFLRSDSALISESRYDFTCMVEEEGEIGKLYHHTISQYVSQEKRNQKEGRKYN